MVRFVSFETNPFQTFSIGAAIGYGLGKASSPQQEPRVPQTVVAPVIGRRGGGALVNIRF